MKPTLPAEHTSKVVVQEGNQRIGDHPKWTIPTPRNQKPHRSNNVARERDPEPFFKPESSLTRENTTIGVFGRLLVEQIDLMQKRLVRDLQAPMGSWVAQKEELEDKVRAFEQKVLDSCKLARQGMTGKTSNPIFYRLRQAFLQGDISVLGVELKNAYVQLSSGTEFEISHVTNQEKLADMRSPLDWYPATRALQREIHLHVGPTNSGKTYHALKRLEEAKTGIYAGPLRLLAHEVYSRFNAKGKLCALITGEEHRVPENMKDYMTSCTVEMVPLNAKLDVAVIDEIQMMADQERGWAWTQAFLGVQAKEVHLCGELRATDLIQKLCAIMGDKLIIHNYERLTPLKSMKDSLRGNLDNLQKGDAIILFSRVAIHAMKTDIEKKTGKRCAVVYGSLPPETRAQQAALFNDPDNDYDFLVASDAVGMGLNLSIKRVIFEATSKFDGMQYRVMHASHIKQIAGRAGRFKTAAEAIQTGVAGKDSTDSKSSKSDSVGYVTTLENFDLPIVRAAMRTEVEPLKAAGILPPSDIIERFASYFPSGTPFSYIILRLHEISTLSPLFFMCQLTSQIDVADAIQEFDLTPMERLKFMGAPISLRDVGFLDITKELASCVSSKSSNGNILSLKTFNLELLDKDIHDHPKGAKGFLRSAESLHKAITLYLWLSYRFAGLFTSHALAFHLKELTEKKIEECLSVFEFNSSAAKARKSMRRKQIVEQMKELQRREDGLEDGDVRIQDIHDDSGAGSQTPDLERILEESDEDEEAVDLETVVETGSGQPGAVGREDSDIAINGSEKPEEAFVEDEESPKPTETSKADIPPPEIERSKPDSPRL